MTPFVASEFFLALTGARSHTMRSVVIAKVMCYLCISPILLVFLAGGAPLEADEETRVAEALEGFGTVHTQPDGRITVAIAKNADEAMKAIGALDGPTLSEIKLLYVRTPCMSPASANVVQKLTSLELLHVDAKCWSRGYSNAVAASKSIKEVWGESSGIDADDLRLISQAKQMEALMIGQNPLKGADLACLANLTNLYQLSLHRLDVSAGDLHFLQKMKNMSWLSLRGCARIDDSVIPLVSNCKSLFVLTATGTQISKDGARMLQETIPSAIISTGELGKGHSQQQ